LAGNTSVLLFPVMTSLHCSLGYERAAAVKLVKKLDTHGPGVSAGGSVISWQAKSEILSLWKKKLLQP